MPRFSPLHGAPEPQGDALRNWSRDRGEGRASEQFAPRDAWVCIALFSAVFLYLAAWPNDLGPADESYFLLEAKRIANGEVLYRDVFWFAMPLAHWLMAFLFTVFGTTVEVARLSMATLHGLMAVALFLACRQLGVRRALAVLPGLAHLALCFAPWHYASPHWFSTFLIVLTLLALLGDSMSATRVLLVGLLVGGLASIHQQKGVIFFAGVSLLLVLRAVVDGRFGNRRELPGLRRQLIVLCVGTAIVFVPVLVVCVASAGIGTFVQQVVVFPFAGYRPANRTAWGEISITTVQLAQYTRARLLTLLPLVVLVDIARAAVAWRRGEDAPHFHRMLTLGLFGAMTVASIAYNPDFIHLAFIAPVLFVLVVDVVESVLRRLRWPALGWALAASAACALGWQMAQNMVRVRERNPIIYESRFGRVALPDQRVVDLVERIQDLVHDAPSREIFVFPVCTSLYLLTGTNNPTPHQILLPFFNLPKQADEVIDALEREQVPYVVVCPFPYDDPVFEYIQQHYECLDSQEQNCVLYRRIRTT